MAQVESRYWQLAANLHNWLVPELRWDYHTVRNAEQREVFRAEIERRGESLHGYMKRRGGEPVPGWRWKGFCKCGAVEVD